MGATDMVTQEFPCVRCLASKNRVATPARWVVATEREPIFL